MKTILVAIALAGVLGAQGPAPAPAAFLGFEPGTARRLADYDQAYAYFEALAAGSDRVRFASIGRTTEGRELGLAIISSAANLARLDAIRADQARLADPRRLREGELGPILDRAPVVVAINASIHSHEVGPTQAMLPLAWGLATTQDPSWLEVLDDVVVVMLPCHNPDGYEKQVAWYRRFAGSPFEACPLPGLYHRYAGHDNNRDWFMFNLAETKLTVEHVYRRWIPQIVMDLHQMGPDAPRMFIPPYDEPVEPNVDPLLVGRLNELGVAVRKDLEEQGFTGIVNRALFDAWSPSRAYMHYHGGVRFLVEVASCRVATPIDRKGGRWALEDIVRHHVATARSVLRQASAHRRAWVSGFHDVFRRSCASLEGPAAFAIPFDGRRGGDALHAAGRIVEILRFGGVEVSVMRDPPRAIVPRGQPYFPFARALLENTPYPVTRPGPGAPMRRPYDMTTHHLGLLCGVDVAELAAPPPPDALRPWDQGRHLLPAPPKLPAPVPAITPDVALYSSHVPNVMDEGWLRFVLERPEILGGHAATTLLDDDTIAGALSDEPAPRVLIFPSLNADLILHGNRTDEWPPEWRGGISPRGAEAVVAYVREGGTLVAIKDATALPIQLFRLPIRNALAGPLDAPPLDVVGAILGVDLDPGHPISASLTRVAAVFQDGKAFEPDPDPACDHALKPLVVGRWATADRIRLAGHAPGAAALSGKGAIIECAVGKGRVILFAFSPYFRGQALGTIPLFRSAIGRRK